VSSAAQVLDSYPWHPVTGEVPACPADRSVASPELDDRCDLARLTC